MQRALLLALCVAGCGRLSFDEVVPSDAPGPPEFQLSVRGGHGCALLTDGRVSCWGENGSGELGRGNTSTFETQGFAAVTDIVYIATGEGASFALDRAGVLWSWGINDYGQLGLGRISIAEATPAIVLIPERVTRLATGEYQTCAVTISGDVYCWGASNCMANGDGTLNDNPTPTKVVGVSNMVNVAMHDALACASDAAGAVLCWGASFADAGGCFGQKVTPTAPVGLPPVADLQGGCHMAMCAVDRSGGAWCWGENVSFNIGDGTAMPRLDPVRVMDVSSALGISTGHRYTCARTSSEVKCWGENIVGQLGIDAASTFIAPTAISLPFFSTIPVDDVQAGCGTVCARAGETVYCWGENTRGGVGDYMLTNRLTPVQIDVHPR